MGLHKFFHHSAIVSCITFHIWKSVDCYFSNKVYRGILRNSYVLTKTLKCLCTLYTHSLPIRNGVKSLWVRFLYFPDFWMVFVSYFPNFLWSPFLIFFIYFFEKHKFIFMTKNLDIFTHYSIAIVWFECFFFELSAFWHLFGYFSSKAIHFLVVNKKNRFLFWKIQWVAVSYDWRIWWVVSYKSISYRKGLRVTHNMTKDCSLIFQFCTWKQQAQNMLCT